MQTYVDCGFEPREDEYKKDGMIYCKKCNAPRSFDYAGKSFRCICECQEEARKIEEYEKIRMAKIERYRVLQQNSLIGERYANASFKNTEITNAEFKKAYDFCLKYCQAYEKVKANGYGIYFWGTCGSGKTHLTACMANFLMASFNSVLVTNFFEIAKAIKKTFSRSLYSESEFIDSLAAIDFLFIDDLGTERVQKDGEDTWLQEKIYDVINKRYNAQKPTVFTSNYTLKQLIEERGIMEKTVSRIAEMSNWTIHVNSGDYRLKNRKVADL